MNPEPNDVRGDGTVRLRAVAPHDLPRMYAMQLDPESNRVAVTSLAFIREIRKRLEAKLA